MPLREMDIESVVVGSGPVASLVVLKSHPDTEGTTFELPIRIGNIEASAISMGIQKNGNTRPMTHDLLASVIDSLGGRLRSVRVISVEGTTFFAQLELVGANGVVSFVDARPSDAIALAVRVHAPIYAEETVLNTASMPNFRGVESAERKEELQRFHEFVETISPEDFSNTTEE